MFFCMKFSVVVFLIVFCKCNCISIRVNLFCIIHTSRHLACEEERMEAVKLLIEAGANTDTLNKVSSFKKHSSA